MRVLVFPADAYGCGYYRLIWPAQVVRHLGIDVVIQKPTDNSGFGVDVMTKSDGTRVLRDIEFPSDIDVLVMQRPAYKLHPQMIEMLQSRGVAVVIDMDDDMTNIHPQSSSYAMYSNRIGNRNYSWRAADDSCRLATLVTTSTVQLQKIYARHGRGVVLDNYIPAYAIAKSDGNSRDVFGWGGTIKSHPDDPHVMGGAVSRLMREQHKFRVVGSDFGIKSAFKLGDAENVDSVGNVPFEHWLQVLGENLGVGIAPLAISPFNTSKSRLKCLEYMARGIPWVASPRAEYRRLAREADCGFLADTPKQWYTHVKKLLTDDALYVEQQQAAWTYMQNQTYELHAWRWAEAWHSAYDIARGYNRAKVVIT